MIITKKYPVDSANEFPTESIVRPLVFKKTTRQRGSKAENHQNFKLDKISKDCQGI